MTVDASMSARTGEVLEELPVSSSDEVAAVLSRAAAAAPAVAALPPAVRRDWLKAVADALGDEPTAARLVAAADHETGLGEVRLTGELARCAGQLRFYGDVAAEGSWLEVTIDHAAGAAPDLRRMQVPLGPVAVLGASNFPFGFGVLGNDTGSAIAAGCPVVVKAHPAHPRTSRLLAEVATAALAAAGAPDGTFALVSGFAAGTTVVQAPEISALAFTGSQRGGLALWEQANRRAVPIPVYAEMGTINPAVLTVEGTERLDEVATGFVGSFTLGMGQFCTKPGLLLAPAGHDVPNRVASALTEAAPTGWLLTGPIATAYSAGVDELVAAGGRVLATAPAADGGWTATATVLEVAAADLAAGSRLLEECFGPVALVAEYADRAELDRILDDLQGALAASVQSGGPDDPDLPGLVATLSARVGRVMVDDWPTGVAFTWAQQHGGPWPATTAPSATSVGAAALGRFTRPVTWQSVPSAALPEALRDDNSWRVPRRIDGVSGGAS
ncbi:MAG: aldehyde dehydrogenase family protein [Nocardioides sp.]|uniref:aldehyde dehydrogenase family protein n=1 Tax=Nocardioides sp. TaxID=35761 RepID=UPI0039E3C863